MKKYSESSETPKMESRSHSVSFLKKATKLAAKFGKTKSTERKMK